MRRDPSGDGRHAQGVEAGKDRQYDEEQQCRPAQNLKHKLQHLSTFASKHAPVMPADGVTH